VIGRTRQFCFEEILVQKHNSKYALIWIKKVAFAHPDALYFSLQNSYTKCKKFSPKIACTKKVFTLLASQARFVKIHIKSFD
jgi:hypothetical protein